MHILEDLIQKIKLAKGPVVLYTNIKATTILKTFRNHRETTLELKLKNKIDRSSKLLWIL